MTNKRIVLASRPVGPVSEANFRLEEAPLPKPAEGEVLVRNLWLSLDPYMRGRMSDAKSYVKGVEIGELMVGQTVGEVLESRHPKLKLGDNVLTQLGWQLYGCTIDYKAGALREQLKENCPNGVDVYFDNVGGEILDTLLTRMNLFARVVVCGSIADYNALEPYRVRNWRAILVNRLRVQGMIVFDWKERYGEALKTLGGYFGEGRLKYRESVVHGLENAPRGLIDLLAGRNFGKQLVKL